RIGRFRSVWLKMNEAECRRAAGADQKPAEKMDDGMRQLAQAAGRPVFCTGGDQGIRWFDPRGEEARAPRAPAYPVEGPIDVVGAGDSTSAGIACALAAGADLGEAAAFGNLVASITIQQIGVTGAASPDQVRRRWQEVRDIKSPE